MSDQAEDSTEVKGLKNAIKYVDEQQAIAGASFQKFQHNFEELTGMKPNQPVNALDVFKIVLSHWGEPKGD